MSRAPSFRRSYGNVGHVLPKEANQTPLARCPPANAYRPGGWCANGHAGEVAPTQLELGGPVYPLCRRCNTEAAEYRDDYRGFDVEDADETERFPLYAAVSKSFKRVVPEQARGTKYWIRPKQHGDAETAAHATRTASVYTKGAR